MHRYKQHVRPRDHGRLRRRPAEQVLAEVIRSALTDRPGPLLIAVGGPGGTGKSTLAGRLRERLGDAAVLRLDDYKTSRADRRKAGIFGPHPDANKMALIAEHLRELRRNQAFDKPVYDPAIGDDARICQALRAGAIGFVSAAANALPELYASLDACAKEHRWGEAESCQANIPEALARLGDQQIPALKRLVRSRIERYPATVRPPLTE